MAPAAEIHDFRDFRLELIGKVRGKRRGSRHVEAERRDEYHGDADAPPDQRSYGAHQAQRYE